MEVYVNTIHRSQKRIVIFTTFDRHIGGVQTYLRLVAELLGEGGCLWAYPFDPKECLRHIALLDRSYAAAVASLKNTVREQGDLAMQIVEEMRSILGD